MDGKIGTFLGEKSPWGVCLFCGETKVKMSQHIRLRHKNEKRLIELETLPQKLKEAGMELLIREGNHKRNNLRAAATCRGIMIPVRRTPEFRPPIRVAHCQFCFAVIDTSHFNRHVSQCNMALSTEDECILIGKHLHEVER
jgi:hypothetical protein